MGNLVGVHGLDNKPSADELETAWKAALEEGLSRRSKVRRHFSLCINYWADLFYSSPLKSEPEPYLPSNDASHTPSLEGLTYESDQLRGLAAEHLGEKYPDLLRYYREPDLGRRTRTRLELLLKDFQGCSVMLLAHSMGCLIAYEVIDGLAEGELSIELVTFGCPLGFPQLWRRMQADHGELEVPSVVRSWTNYLDPRDPVATLGLAEVFAPGRNGITVLDRVVHNDYRNPRGEPNPHKIYGYLRSRAFSDQTIRFLDQSASGGSSDCRKAATRE